MSAKLDQVGAGAIGGPHFRINRSRYYIKEFTSLLETLEVGSVQTWISYEQFVKRGLGPAFEYILEVGARLATLRARLLTVTEMIETSALVAQSAATRHNTAVLRKATTYIGIALLIFILRDYRAIFSALSSVREFLIVNRLWP